MPQNNGNKRQTNRQPQRRPQGSSQGRAAGASMSNEELRREHRAERQRQQRMRRRVFYVTLSLIVVIIGIVLSLTVFFNITNIKVEGNSIYTDKEIIAASGVQIGDNLFLVSRDTVAQSIMEKLPFAGTVEFSNKLPGTLTLKVADTSVKCALETEEGYVLMNESGKVLATVDTLEEIYENAVYIDASGKVIEGEAPTVETEEGTTSGEAGKPEEGTTAAGEEASKGDDVADETATGDKGKAETEGDATEETKSVKYVLSNEKIIILKGVVIKNATPGMPLEVKNEKTMELYQEIMAVLSQNKIEDINEINLADTFSVSLMYQDRIEILVGSVSNLENKLALCKEILDNQNEISPYQKGTVDLTIDKKAYFSPYVEPTTAAPITPEAEGTSEDGEGTENGEDTSGTADESASEGTTKKESESGNSENSSTE